MSEFSKNISELKISENLLKEIKEKIKNVPDLKEKLNSFLTGDISEILNIIFGGTIQLAASDLHFEPVEEGARLRARIDGVLQDIVFFPKRVYELLVSRIKLISRLKLNIVSQPQDGRFSVLFENLSVEIRVSTLPSEFGESIVMRILNPRSLISLDQMGLREDLLKTFRREIERPNGMIIVTGPTGSGKTTTLYAFLKEINEPGIKIITIEDPIEYHLEGISQTQVNPKAGYTFANGLRAIVRQDPDVILVGEIRDLETASIALQAALTGHLVLSTLHTNDAAGTVARLCALGEKPVNIAPALNMAVAQRLVRKVCKNCVKFETPSKENFEKLKSGLKNIKNVEKDIKIPKSVGCKDCNFTGYRGRIGIFEAFLVDEEMEKFILTSPSISELKEKAIQKGMITMYQDGLLKVLNGITTIEEVERVAEE